MKNSTTYIGLMSGTSLDGVDGVVVQFSEEEKGISILANAHQAFSMDLKNEAMALQCAGENEIHREALLANQLAHVYAKCVDQLIGSVSASRIQAIGVHGQTIRHRPELGYTRQTNNPALLAELTGIDVIADFRSRDIAAGGQGAPLVPAFHRALFGQELSERVVVNIGGMSNISILYADGHTTGFDTGPGNVLMDAWIHQHHAQFYDENGAWAASGQVDLSLLSELMNDTFFAQLPPKSTGRDLFHMAWLQQKLAKFSHVQPADVQASLCALTVHSITNEIKKMAPKVEAIYVCGGGAYNQYLMQLLKKQFASIEVTDTQALGVEPNLVEAIAFAWLAKQFSMRNVGNLPQVTGAKGERILGALYPA